MWHTDSQYSRLTSILLALKHDKRPYFTNLLGAYSDSDIRQDVASIYAALPPTAKSTIVANLPDYLCRRFMGAFESVDTLIEELLDVRSLTANHDRVIQDQQGERWFVETTTGTTGQPFPVAKSQRERLCESNYLMRCRRTLWEGATLRNGFLLMHEVDPFLSNLDYRDDRDKYKNLDVLFDYFVEKQPAWMFSSVIILNKLVEFLILTGRAERLGRSCLHFIETTSQKISDDDKASAENVFHTQLANNYGCREVWNVAYSCQHHSLHLNTTYLMCDVVDEHGDIIGQEGQPGELIVTNTTNATMPFVKYYVGDYVSIHRSTCPCGSASPKITLEDGRKHEKLRNTNCYGPSVFRKVLRTLIFRDRLRDLKRVKIIQDADFHLSVYAEIRSGDRSVFERRFSELSRFFIEGFDRFSVDYIYHYPFEDGSGLKEEVFRCTVE